MMAADRRRVNGPASGTTPPVFTSETPASSTTAPPRAPDELRKIFLKTSLTPPATGSAFYELSAPFQLKLTASVYGPRPLPPSAGFSPRARLTAELKFAPFSTPGTRRGYVRDALERDLSQQLQVALARSVKTAAYPKSGIDVFVTILDCGEGEGEVLAGAINCAAAAVADAGIECLDLVSAGTAAVMSDGTVVLDPDEAWRREEVQVSAVVAYMAARDEVAMVWVRGEAEEEVVESVVEGAVGVAKLVRGVVNDAVRERLEFAIEAGKSAKGKGKEVAESDVEMTG